MSRIGPGIFTSNSGSDVKPFGEEVTPGSRSRSALYVCFSYSRLTCSPRARSGESWERDDKCEASTSIDWRCRSIQASSSPIISQLHSSSGPSFAVSSAPAKSTWTPRTLSPLSCSFRRLAWVRSEASSRRGVSWQWSGDRRYRLYVLL